MQHAVIAATGLFTPEQSVSNAELVDSYNAWADGWNARQAAQIEAGELEAKSHSSPEFIEKYLVRGGFEPLGGTPEEFAAFLREDKKVGAIMAKLAIRPE